MHQLRAFLTSLFPLSDQDFAQLAPHVVPRAVAKGAHLLEAGQVCGAVWFATTGFLRLYYVGPDGHEVNCRFAGTGGFLTDFQSFLTQQPATAGRRCKPPRCWPCPTRWCSASTRSRPPGSTWAG